MPAYIMGIIEEIHDPEMMGQYVEQVAPVVQQYGGRYVVVSNQVEATEGDLAPAILAALEFADMDQVRLFWASPEYTAIKHLRHNSTRSKVLFVDGANPLLV